MARFNHTLFRTLFCRPGLFEQVCKLLLFGKKRRLSRQGQMDQSPAFSPDARVIVFKSDRTGDNQLWAMYADGSHRVQITKRKGGNGAPSFSPDGKTLLFETGGEKRCDAVVVVSAPPEMQRARVMTRPGMTEEKFASLLGKQVPDAEKRRRADFVVDTSKDLDSTRAQVRAILQAAAKLPKRRQ